METSKRLHEAREYWDQAAVAFDQEADHGLQDPHILQAWTELLKGWTPSPGMTVLDVGCGTGSLSVILTGLGHFVTGIDVSPNMLVQAQSKANAAKQKITWCVMDAAIPGFKNQSFDIVICRHVLWALPDPAQVVRHWLNLLRQPGRLILIEGHWATGGGLHATELLAGLPSALTPLPVQYLSEQPIYWGKVVTDERYVIIADRRA